MKHLTNYHIGVDQGETLLFSDFENNGPMWGVVGPREVVKRVEFTRAFRSDPAVHVGLSMWDLDNASNPRMDIRADNITHGGFDIVFRTWGDTRIARVRASWMAIGELPHTDDWDVD